MKTLIGTQDQYIATLNAAAARWSHKPGYRAYMYGGQFPRTAKAAFKKALIQLQELGYTEEQARSALDDAKRMFELEQLCD